jgi:hypothetical protein
MWKPIGFLLFLTSLATSAYAVPPVLNYAGQVSVDGELLMGADYSNLPSLMQREKLLFGATMEPAWQDLSQNHR